MSTYKKYEALILVDIQNDFCPGGALPAENGDEVVPIANKLMSAFHLVVASQDWHPQNHKSFASNHAGKKVGDVIDLNGIDQILWPDHCVQGSHGAEFVANLNTGGINKVFRKGTDPEIDSYSAFYDNGHRKATGLGDFLKEHNIRRVYVMGLATDYCVKYTAIDAAKLGFETTVVIDGCRGVNASEGDVEKAIGKMKEAGAEITYLEDLLPV